MIDLERPYSSKDLQQLKRLKFLDFLLTFRGWFTRLDLIEVFKIAPAGATRDISEYKRITSKDSEDSLNVYFDESSKKYVRSPSFKAVYPVNFESAIGILKRAVKLEALGTEQPIPIESPPRLCISSTDNLSEFSRAISNKTCLEVIYVSLSKEIKVRKIAPHSFFESETNWYVRAYCFSNNQFRNFKLSRFSNIKALNERRPLISEPIKDEQWNRWVNLILEPRHQNDTNTIVHDYGMGEIIKNQILVSEHAIEVKVRAAICGFWLQHWNVDCSKDGSLGEKDRRYLLKLANPETLYDVESLDIAPGYRTSLPTATTTA